jgi:L-fucose mutarotase/ribose pyranase (RbsD/FucU family)
MSKRRRCELCNATLPPHGFYLVRIDVFAEPSMPAVSSQELAEMDLDATLDKLLRQMKKMSTDELQDQVHRRFEYCICAACHKLVLANPLGKPRRTRLGKN